ncbi:MAG: bifunctional hydroxymethylpyrimidine kinase/phosphomethylpyrimidine kinase [Clostridiales bacterium]|jgi:pyridoxine kinase|nr:bifunctional hydroxymethylpyrimidine kinase/phosphomethylpyrimidine kinase [Clostridiales bacterium]
MKKVLCINDLSCIGRCSLSVSLPILACQNIEAVPLPTAVYSMHTGYSGHISICNDIDQIVQSWNNLKLKFDCIYSGFLKNQIQIQTVKNLIVKFDCPSFIDPCFADGGQLYDGYDMGYVEHFKSLIVGADVILPNITEACFLTGTKFKQGIDTKRSAEDLAKKLLYIGVKSVVISGVCFDNASMGAVLASSSGLQYFSHAKIEGAFSGAGDILSSIFVGQMTQKKGIEQSLKTALRLTVKALSLTKNCDFGINFYGILQDLINLD